MARRDGKPTPEQIARAQQQGRGPAPPAQQPGSGPPAAAAQAAALTATAATVATAAAAATPALAAIGAAQAIANASAGILAAFDRYLKIRLLGQQADLDDQLVREHPALTDDDRRRILAEEMRRERAFAAKARERLAADLPAALAVQDATARRDAVDALIARERRYADQREVAMRERIVGRAHAAVIKAASPEGAYWRINPLLDNCARCRAMAGKVWPWEVLEIYGPPLHGNCDCSLWTIAEARRMGWITDADFATMDNLPSGDIMESIASVLDVDAGDLDRALILLEAWDGRRHPRDRSGRWRHNPQRHAEREAERSNPPPAGTADPPAHPETPAVARTFETVGEAGDWATETFDPWTASLSKSERDSLAMYKDDTKGRYRVLNDVLRGDRVPTDWARRNARRIDEALRRNPLTEPVVAYRAVPGTHFGPEPITPDRVLDEPAFLSASLLRQVAEQDYAPLRRSPLLLAISVPAGTPVGYLDDLGERSADRELLLPAGASLRVHSVHEAEGVRTVQVTLQGFRRPALLGDPA